MVIRFFIYPGVRRRLRDGGHMANLPGGGGGP